MLSSTGGKLPQCNGLDTAIQTAVLHNVSTNVFKALEEHMFECSIEDNHVYNLIKRVAKCYAKIRFHHLGDLISSKECGRKIRKKLSKLVLFKDL